MPVLCSTQLIQFPLDINSNMSNEWQRSRAHTIKCECPIHFSTRRAFRRRKFPIRCISSGHQTKSCPLPSLARSLYLCVSFEIHRIDLTHRSTYTTSSFRCGCWLGSHFWLTEICQCVPCHSQLYWSWSVLCSARSRSTSSELAYCHDKATQRICISLFDVVLYIIVPNLSIMIDQKYMNYTNDVYF